LVECIMFKDRFERKPWGNFTKEDRRIFVGLREEKIFETEI